MWADHPDFIPTVEEGWGLNVEGTPQFQLCRKLKALKSSLKAFNNLHYGHISARAKEADLVLQNAQTCLESNARDVAVRDSLGDLRKKATFLTEAERQFYYQKAKIHFLKQGDRNTKFFHDMVKRNAARNSILAITKADSSIITSAPDIAQEFIDFYTSLLGTEDQTLPVDDGVFHWEPSLTSELASNLCRAVTPTEAKTAIFQISDNKAPGPDGYTSCFFKKAWNIVGDRVCRAVMDFFRSGRMLRQLNHTIIALVPKSEHSPSVADYRSISCCNVIYKVITKIIADRLSPALEQLIDSSQAAFVGAETSQIIYSWLKKWSGSTRGNGFHLVVPLTSTYGRYLIRSHGRSSPEYSTVALNGSLHGLFPRTKGLRQGDPMSPALFLLCMEYFSRLIKRNTTNSDFNFHPRCEKLKITHLLFADDVMLFSRGDLPSIHILMECLQEFRDVSGLAVNTVKSNIFTAGIQDDTLDEALAMTEFAKGHMPVRYLGIPLAVQRLSVTNYSPLADQIASWSSYGIPREHQWPGRIFAIRRRKAVWVSGISNPRMLLSLPESYGTFIARQTPYGPSGSMRFTSGGPHFRTGSRRRATRHSFDDLPRSRTELSQASIQQMQLSSIWQSGPTSRD
ncbi:UNVERIFIED_CONTAM: putative mitochondrial protein [Sesamum radiatum]|uniref:Mitochondrial protein n=1 Tax=Sesamum radiatum TaxID=300843 RepID=A0AAW2V0Z2_SESRA